MFEPEAVPLPSSGIMPKLPVPIGTTIPKSSFPTPTIWMVLQPGCMGFLVAILTIASCSRSCNITLCTLLKAHLQAQVFYVRFWMLHHGGTSSKRSVFWGNLSTMRDLDKGRMTQSERQSKTSVKTTRTSTEHVWEWWTRNFYSLFDLAMPYILLLAPTIRTWPKESTLTSLDNVDLLVTKRLWSELSP